MSRLCTSYTTAHACVSNILWLRNIPEYSLTCIFLETRFNEGMNPAVLTPTLIPLHTLMKTMATELHRRWLDVSDAEYERRMRARNRRNGDNGCAGIILLIIIFSCLDGCS